MGDDHRVFPGDPRPVRPPVPQPGEPPAARRLILLIIVATLPLFLVLPIKDYVEQIGNYPAAVSCILLLTGAVLFLSDRMAHGHKTARSATLKDALLIGVAQSVATLPGLSRSGSTIAAGMACGLDRKFAVRFSFLMSLPAVLGATILKAVDVVQEGGVDLSLLPKYLLGMAFAGVVGYFSIGLVNLLTAKGKFGAFAYYCWGAGALFLVLSLTGFTLVPAA
ncbi:MAG: undecaprenyl-diphosphate phosphatase [Lawsonibacter sp.]